ncbi:MAG TPA: DUF1549 domain-containing protein, partial [Pirellulaceae bacterium]|nr:DUF1549 domain-containing protein [Pirellulaceae bacterium]
SRLPGIVVDDTAAKQEGTWSPSRHTRPFVGASYIYSAGGAGQHVDFPVEIKEGGTYQVLAAYTSGTNRSETAVYEIPAANGVQTVVVNQQERPKGPFCFQPLGEFTLEAGMVRITVSAEANKKGVVVADAIQVLTPEEFATYKDEFEKNSPKLLAALKADPNQPVVKAAEKKPVETPQETAPVFVRKSPAKPRARLTTEQLDRLMDKHVGGIATTIVVDDESFLRRLTLDLIGRQPTMDEMRAFLADTAADKRVKAVDTLLAAPDFGANWGNYWSDVISYRTPGPELTFLNYSPFKAWLAEQFNQNKGWDETTYNVVTAIGKVADNPAATYIGFHAGDKSRLASETTRVFLSTQIQCAECHDHKFVEMPQETFHHVAAFFVRVNAKLPWNDSGQIVVSSKPSGEHKMEGRKDEMKPIAFSAREVELGRSDVSRRAELADWIVSPENPWFAKAFVNRVWARMMGRGFCEPVDEIGELGDRVLPEIHAALADHFIAEQFDVKDVFRVIALSKGYQREIRDADKGVNKPFLAIPAGRLRGDEVFDSLQAAIEIPNYTPPQGAATGEFRFPPPPKSTRDLVNEAFGFDPSAEQSNVARTMQQAMLLMNNKQVQAQVNADPASGTMLAKLIADETDNEAAVARLYQKVLARKPTTQEISLGIDHVKTAGNRTTGFEDLLWGLINSAEFLSRR